MSTPVTILFDASLGENDSGACFEITARDQAHARQIAAWLQSKVTNKTRTFMTAYTTLVPQRVDIELPVAPDKT